jgi:glycosyltransferase involved in cell wall biosynthesis
MSESSRGCIVFATMEFHPTNPGGAGILIHHTVRLLLEQGFTVVLLFDIGPTEFEQLVNVDRLGIPFAHRLLIYRVDDLCQDLPILPEPCEDIAIAKSIRLDHALRKLTEIHDVDLIELYDYCGHGFHYLAKPAEDRPLVAVRLHSTIELMERKTRAPLAPGRLWLYAMERAQLVLADVVLSPGTAYYEQDIRPLYPALTPDRVLISPPVHMAIGEVEYDPEARNVAFYGRLSTLKGLDTFLRAGVLALEDPVFAGWLGRFVVIGPEDHVATALSPGELRGLIPKDKLARFHFTGRLDHAALIEQLQTVAFACFGNRVESFCYAAHELHTAGIPLIVNRIPAFEDGFETDRSAIFFDGTALDLAEHMKRLAGDAALRLELSRHGKGRAASYWVDHYTGHLSWLRQRRGAAGAPAGLSASAIVLSTGDREAADRTVASLSSLPVRPLILELDAAGELGFAGSRWRGAAGPEGSATQLGLQMVGEACLFVRAGDVVEPQWAHDALRVLAQNPRVGAVGGWIRTHSGIESMSYLYIPELAQLDEPGLRVLLRVGAGQTLAEYLHGWSSQSERSYLLAHRAAGRVSVELPRLSVDTRRAVDLPAIPAAAAAVDFDRYSREFLTLAQSSGAGAPASGSTFQLADSDPDVLATNLIPSLVILRKAARSPGELWVLRLLRDDHFLEFDWSAVMRSGDWVKTAEPEAATVADKPGETAASRPRRTQPFFPAPAASAGSQQTRSPVAPAGAQVTQTGSMRFHARGRTGVDLLLGPACGVCEIVHRGRVHTIDLKQPHLHTHRVWLDELGSARQSRPGAGGRAYLPAPAVSLKPEHAALKTGNIDLVAVAAPADSSIAAMLRFRSGCCVLTPEELGLLAALSPTRGIAYALQAIGNPGGRNAAIDAAGPGGAGLAAPGPAGGIDYALQAIRNTDCRKVAIDAAVPGGDELADQLLRTNRDMHIIGLLGETAPLGASGAIAAYRSLGPWLRLANRFPTRLSVASTSQALIGLFSRCGVRALTIPARLPVLRTVEYGDSAEIEVIVVAGAGTVPNTAHMISAVAHARRTGLGISRLWLPAQDELGARIARSFAAAPELERYENLDTAFCGDPQRRVALGVFPDDDELPEAAALALNWGVLPILGPGSAFARCAGFRDSLCVTYWEDAVAIADALTRTAECFDRLAEDYARFRLDREEMTERGLAALVAGSLDRAEPDLVFGNP